MIVVMEPDASDQAVESVISFLVSAGFDVHRSSGTTTTILGVVGDLSGNDVTVVSEFPGVSQVVRVSEQFRLASRRFRQQSTVIEGPWGSIGGDKPWIAIEAVGPLPAGATLALRRRRAPRRQAAKPRPALKPSQGAGGLAFGGGGG
jgi:3-deoxy-7-phosphoheptulonate synthase